MLTTFYEQSFHKCESLLTAYPEQEASKGLTYERWAFNKSSVGLGHVAGMSPAQGPPMPPEGKDSICTPHYLAQVGLKAFQYFVFPSLPFLSDREKDEESPFPPSHSHPGRR